MKAPLIDIQTPSPEQISAARQAAGLSQAQAAELVGLGDKTRWSEYERGGRVPDAARWALFLLATGQHPQLVVSARRRAG